MARGHHRKLYVVIRLFQTPVNKVETVHGGRRYGISTAAPKAGQARVGIGYIGYCGLLLPATTFTYGWESARLRARE